MKFDGSQLMHDLLQVDDAELLHAYDPRKAHDYYIRTRKLKGRQAGAGRPAGSGPRTGAAGGAGGSGSAGMRPSRRAELVAQKKQLENRLDGLKDLYELKLAAAKKRSGVKAKPAEKDSPDSSTKDKKGKDKGKADKPLTEKQKREKREASKKQYDKENHMGLSMEVEHLQRQVQDMRAKIEKITKNARSKPHQSNNQTAPSRR